MQKLFWTLFLIPFLSLGQSKKWKLCRFDDILSFELPEDYFLTDTLGHFAFNAQGKFGVFGAVKISDPENSMSTSDEVQLERIYDSFEHGFSKSTNGTQISDKRIRIGNLSARQFVYRVLVEEQPKRLETIIVMMKSSAYAFTYTYDYHIARAAEPERDQFFSSITPQPSLTFNDQLTDYNPDIESGKEIGLILRYLTILAVLLCIILWIKKKFKAIRTIKKFFGGAFALFGVFNFLIYGANAFEGIEYSKINQFIFYGFFFLILGLIFLFIKVPITGTKIEAKSE